MDKQVIVDRRPGHSAVGGILLVVAVLVLAWFFLMNDSDRAVVPSNTNDATQPTNTVPTDGQTNTGANAPAPNATDSNLAAARTSARSAVLSLQGRVGADPAYANIDTDLEAVSNSLEAAYINASGDAATRYAQIKTELATLREQAQSDAGSITAASFDDLLRLLAS